MIPDRVFDPFAPEFLADPFPTWSRLRALGSAHRAYFGKCWVLSRYADVAEAARDATALGALPSWEFYGQRSQHGRSRTDEAPIWKSHRLWMLLQNPPHHTRVKTLVQGAFSAAGSHRLAATIERAVGNLFDRTLAGPFDAVRDFGDLLPVQVLWDLLGLPNNVADDVMPKLHALAHSLDAYQTRADIIASSDAVAWFDGLFRSMIAERTQAPRDDIVSMLCRPTSSGEKLTDDEIVANATLIAFAGVDTTASSIAQSFMLLAERPDLLKRVQAEPKFASVLAEELLRLAAPVHVLWRRVLMDHERAGAHFKQGDDVILGVASANRDESAFANPDVIDLDRPKGKPILSFSAGPHYCLGAALARLELETFVRQLACRVRHVETDASTLSMRKTLTVRTPVSLVTRLVAR